MTQLLRLVFTYPSDRARQARAELKLRDPFKLYSVCRALASSSLVTLEYNFGGKRAARNLFINHMRKFRDCHIRETPSLIRLEQPRSPLSAQNKNLLAQVN